MRYAAEISNVAARQPGGRDKIRSTVEEKVPQAVGKSSELMKELMEGVEGLFRGNERSCIIRSFEEFGLGTKPKGDVAK